MEDTSENSKQKIFVCLFSDGDFLSVNILENLLSKNCLVNVVTDDVGRWQKLTTKIANKSRFGITNIKNFNQELSYSYFIFCTGFLKKDEAQKNLSKYLKKATIGNTKSLAILPFESFSLNQSLQAYIPENLAAVYIGDLVGPRMDLESDLSIATCINETLNTRTITLGVGEVFCPIFVSDAAKTLVKWLFAFGPYGKEIFLLGDQVSGATLWKECQKVIGEIKLIYDDKLVRIKISAKTKAVLPFFNKLSIILYMRKLKNKSPDSPVSARIKIKIL